MTTGRGIGSLIRFAAGRSVTFAAALWSAIRRVGHTPLSPTVTVIWAIASHSTHAGTGTVIAPGSGCIHLGKNMWFKGKSNG